MLKRKFVRQRHESAEHGKNQARGRRRADFVEDWVRFREGGFQDAFNFFIGSAGRM